LKASAIDKLINQLRQQAHEAADKLDFSVPEYVLVVEVLALTSFVMVVCSTKPCELFVIAAITSAATVGQHSCPLSFLTAMLVARVL
jgi:hypothetical protein